MRRIISFDRVSADGYFAGPDGNLDWVVPDEEVDKSAGEAIGRSARGAILFGRRTYQQFESFWPHALDEPAKSADPHGPARQSKALRAMAVWINDADKIVFSKTLRDVNWKNARIVREFRPQEIAAMKAQPGSDMLVFGSGSIVSQLTTHGLIDEYQFIVTPVLIGSGQSLVRDVPARLKLHLLEAQGYRSGNVMLRYGLTN